MPRRGDRLRLIIYNHRHAALLIVAAQLLVAIVIAAVLLGLTNAWSAFSALTGGLISVLSNLYLAGRLTIAGGAPVRILSAFYLGELVKIAITVVLFVFAIVVLHVDVLYAVLAYMATLPVYWFALLIRPPEIKTN
jgi:ATP synthase protein I